MWVISCYEGWRLSCRRPRRRALVGYKRMSRPTIALTLFISSPLSRKLWNTCYFKASLALFATPAGSPASTDQWCQTSSCWGGTLASPQLQNGVIHRVWVRAVWNQGPDLYNMLRQSYDYLTIMPNLRSTYDKCLIYKTSYRFTCKIVWSSETVSVN